MSIHSRNDDIILQFGLKKPAFRIIVNSPTTLGSIGLTTGLDPSMTLGCGGWGGNITSDNISPRHLLNIKRLAYETNPAPARPAVVDSGAATSAPGTVPALPKAPARPAPPTGITADALARRIDEFLGARGYRPPAAGSQPGAAAPAVAERPAAPAPGPPPMPAQPAETVEKPTDFVCEDDVRQAIRQGRKIVIGERTIVTPAARDLGEQHRLFVQAAWPR
jgi:acetaldehyde dehydrogenase (acetylating)